MNKTGKSNWVIPVGVIALVVIAGLLVAAQLGFLSQTALAGAGTEVNGGQYLATGSTALTIAGVDALNGGTSVASTSKISVDGTAFTTGVTSASPGNKLAVLLVNNTAYHNAFIPNVEVPAAATKVIEGKFNKNASVTITAFSTNNVVLTTTGSSNQTVAVGGQYAMDIKFDGTSKASTQDMRCIFESTNGTASDKVTFSVPGASFVGSSKPNWYTLAGTNSEVWVYEMPSIVDASTVRGTVQITSATSATLTGAALKIHCATKEYFVDSTTGKVMYDVEDSLGAKQSIASYATTIYFS